MFTLFKTVSPIQERNYDFELNAFRYYIILSQFEMIGMQIIANNLSIVGVMLGSEKFKKLRWFCEFTRRISKDLVRKSISLRNSIDY